MIHFFKQKKPFLKDLIPDNYIDIHSHLLPGIDDGATCIEDTSSLINGLQEIGFKKFFGNKRPRFKGLPLYQHTSREFYQPWCVKVNFGSAGL